MADCPVCFSAIGIENKEDMVNHLNSHKGNLDLMIDKIAEYIMAHEV